jgi:hypothetical protein
MCRGAALAAPGAARSHARAGAHMAGRLARSPRTPASRAAPAPGEVTPGADVPPGGRLPRKPGPLLALPAPSGPGDSSLAPPKVCFLKFVRKIFQGSESELPLRQALGPH